jgi:hypothetical protein
MITFHPTPEQIRTIKYIHSDQLSQLVRDTINAMHTDETFLTVDDIFEYVEDNEVANWEQYQVYFADWPMDLCIKS